MAVTNDVLLKSLLKQADELTTKVELKRAEKDPYFFLTRFCYTLDEHDRENPIKKFPEKRYIRDLCDLFVVEDLLAIEKSRQMMVSWTFMGLALWFTMYKEGVRTFIMSKKEKDANALLDRVKFIYDHLPSQLTEKHRADPYKYCELAWSKRNNIIQAIPQGADQVRQYTSSLIISDESAFQERSEEAYTAAKPSLSGGGKYVAISTPNGREFFERIVHDKLNEKEN